jgi:hypothetical protein
MAETTQIRAVDMVRRTVAPLAVLHIALARRDLPVRSELDAVGVDRNRWSEPSP